MIELLINMFFLSGFMFRHLFLENIFKTKIKNIMVIIKH